jgi:hypothetical protein
MPARIASADYAALFGPVTPVRTGTLASHTAIPYPDRM